MAPQQREERECSCLANCSHFVQHGLESIFSKIGRMVGIHPWKVIITSCLLTLVFGAGFSNWTTESRVNKLWIPQDTEAEQQSLWVSEVYGYETRTEQILLRPNDEGNVLTAKYVQQYWLAHTLMVNTTSRAVEGYEDEFPGFYSWDGYNNSNSICLRLGRDCAMDTILDITGYQYDDVYSLTDDLLLEIINDPNITANIDLSEILGGIERDEDDYIISAAIIAGTYKVQAAAIDVNNALIDPSREQWEVNVNYDLLDSNIFDDVTIIPYFAEAFGEEFGSAIAADGMSYAVGCCLLIFYTSIALGKRDYVHSMVGLALCAIMTVGLAVMGSYGLAAALSVIYTPLSSSLPFLALGLGVDDAFIIVGEYQQQTKDLGAHISPAKRMEATMKHAGVSILITSVTDFVAFGIGSTTVLPALKAFCLYASFGVFFVFMLNITFFAACVVLDSQRAGANRMDCCCCFKLKTPHPMFPELTLKDTDDGNTATNIDADDGGDELSYCCCLHKLPSEASRKMFGWIGIKIMNKWVKISILSIAMGVLAFCIYGASQLEQDFRLEWFLPDSSYLQEYYAWKDEYFSSGTPIWIYGKDVDYFDKKTELLECNDLLLNASYTTGWSYDWHSNYWKWINSNDITVNEYNYYDLLAAYLYSSDGAQYIGAIEWINSSQPSQGIAGSYMFGLYKESAVIDATSQVDAMYDVRDDVTDIVGENEKNIFPFTYQMLFWEQYAVISSEFYRNLILAICVVFGIALILIPKISAALLVLLTVVITIIDVMGFMWLWGLTIDAVTVCYTVIAIGLSVDYSAHVGEAFMLSSKLTKSQKVIDSLYRIGASVFNGAFSTFLAVVAMANSQTYVFRVFFKQFFLVTLIGSIHGLIVLPVLLSWFGPNSSLNTHHSSTDDKEKKQKQLQLQITNSNETPKSMDVVVEMNTNNNNVDDESQSLTNKNQKNKNQTIPKTEVEI